jgi:hypothetical protein
MKIKSQNLKKWSLERDINLYTNDRKAKVSGISESMEE